MLGLQIGATVAQTSLGHQIGHVCDHKEDANDPALRVYRTPERQRFPTDSADVVGLLCLHGVRFAAEVCSSSVLLGVTMVLGLKPSQTCELAAGLSCVVTHLS
jgi:hypothetical protein